MKKVFLSILTVAMIIAQTGCAGKAVGSEGIELTETGLTIPVTKQSFYFDTICSISIYDMEDMSEENANKVIEDAFSICQHYESLFSRTLEGTDIYNINNAGGDWVECDQDTVEIVQIGIDYCALSSGKFDITVGRLSDLWDFHADDPEVPSEEDVQRAIESVNYKNIEIDGNSIRLTDKDAEIDLGGIAKGYIADKVSKELRVDGVTSAIISLGGNIEIVGQKSEDTAFTIGVEKPYSNGTEIIGTMQLFDGTAVTSGVYERYFESNGETYHHILDASTGWPVETDIIGVTIRAGQEQSVDCDALATICILIGEKDAMNLIESLEGFEAVFIMSDGQVEESSGMEFELYK